jgi:hypothetical protein
MHRPSIALDRIVLDRHAIAPRSSTLHIGAGERPELQSSPWWVYLAGERLPASLSESHDPMLFRASTAGGRELGGEVRVVERLDDPRGTRLILAGLRPLASGAGR